MNFEQKFQEDFSVEQLQANASVISELVHSPHLYDKALLKLDSSTDLPPKLRKEKKSLRKSQ